MVRFCAVQMDATQHGSPERDSSPLPPSPDHTAPASVSQTARQRDETSIVGAVFVLVSCKCILPLFLFVSALDRGEAPLHAG
jgi:hypothetical protein